MTTPRRRLHPDERRNQLIDIGARLFATHPYEEVLMEQVGAEAGVSRALVYRYFPTKRDLFAAIYQRAADRLLAATETGRHGSLTEWVRAGLDAHIDFFADNARTTLAANRELAGDPVIQGIISAELGALRGLMVEAAEVPGDRRELVSAALLAWLSFVRVLCVEWLQHRAFSRDELRETCLRALSGILHGGAGEDG
ncbi:TetR/AcrR family transcriptional regulator [Amycolatopsis cynarae]|uniref:TetR/AcrR family transcriptional regulator n=1 Tax=Amycolatopsis cynarae TaxID=2995223 RepID=A0ABY7B6Q0_9PSEU|nr:TetR/AcrR family transcriptional regulator [Amycolatopsis sp. HUAS 11-8]WAL67662.1 TetR/AcrR family transcriptional regulator [Amycolatopsis sp. HUAS 11-8]